MTRRTASQDLERRAKYIFIVLACSGVPFLFWRGVWGHVLLKPYLMTSFLAFILVYSYWESRKERWFWKAMLPIGLVHIGLMIALCLVNLEFPLIDSLPGLTYAGLTVILGVEVKGALPVIETFRTKEKRALS